MRILGYFCPFSNKFHSCDDFSKLNDSSKALTVIATGLATILSLGLAGVAVFRKMVEVLERYSFKQIKTQKDEEEHKNDSKGEATAKKIQNLISLDGGVVNLKDRDNLEANEVTAKTLTTGENQLVSSQGQKETNPCRQCENRDSGLCPASHYGDSSDLKGDPILKSNVSLPKNEDVESNSQEDSVYEDFSSWSSDQEESGDEEIELLNQSSVEAISVKERKKRASASISQEDDSEYEDVDSCSDDGGEEIELQNPCAGDEDLPVKKEKGKAHGDKKQILAKRWALKVLPEVFPELKLPLNLLKTGDVVHRAVESYRKGETMNAVKTVAPLAIGGGALLVGGPYVAAGLTAYKVYSTGKLLYDTANYLNTPDEKLAKVVPN